MFHDAPPWVDGKKERGAEIELINLQGVHSGKKGKWWPFPDPFPIERCREARKWIIDEEWKGIDTCGSGNTEITPPQPDSM